jgi:hypothetical protein
MYRNAIVDRIDPPGGVGECAATRVLRGHPTQTSNWDYPHHRPGRHNNHNKTYGTARAGFLYAFVGPCLVHTAESAQSSQKSLSHKRSGVYETMIASLKTPNAQSHADIMHLHGKGGGQKSAWCTLLQHLSPRLSYSVPHLGEVPDPVRRVRRYGCALRQLRRTLLHGRAAT